MNIPRYLLLPILLLFAMPMLSAETRTPEQVRKRMEANLPALDELRKTGRVGENNKGYLEARNGLSPAEKRLVQTENADRRFVYEMLASRANTTLERIERARAEQIRNRSTAGVWLQSPAGEWYRKR